MIGNLIGTFCIVNLFTTVLLTNVQDLIGTFCIVNVFESIALTSPAFI